MYVIYVNRFSGPLEKLVEIQVMPVPHPVYCLFKSVMDRHHSQRENESLAQTIQDQNANKEKQELTHAWKLGNFS
jgi:hypothetical protein